VSLPIAWSYLHRILGIWIPTAPLDNDDADANIPRFQQLRNVMHLNSNNAEVRGKDALYKNLPLLNILKKPMGAYMIYGFELSLDEASAASRSSYNRHIVFYTTAKNCGKFHFRFCILSDASNVAALTLKVATRNDSDPCDPNEMIGSIQEESKYSDLNKLVQQMCKKYNGTVEQSTWTINRPLHRS
jgi:hypothetical protein